MIIVPMTLIIVSAEPDVKTCGARGEERGHRQPGREGTHGGNHVSRVPIRPVGRTMSMRTSRT